MSLETWSPSGTLWGEGGINGKPPGDGWQQTGTRKVPVYSAPKNGGPTYRTVPIYTRVAQAAESAASNPADNGGSAPRDTGKYEDITAAYQEEIDKANASAEQWKNQVTETINTQQMDFSSQLDAIQRASDDRINQLNQMMLQQQQAAAQQQALMTQQLQAAQAAYQEQARQTAALGQAFVPAPNQSAATAATGDERTDATTKATSSGSSKLSELAIVSGLGTNTNLLAGLQLA